MCSHSYFVIKRRSANHSWRPSSKAARKNLSLRSKSYAYWAWNIKQEKHALHNHSKHSFAKWTRHLLWLATRIWICKYAKQALTLMFVRTSSNLTYTLDSPYNTAVRNRFGALLIPTCVKRPTRRTDKQANHYQNASVVWTLWEKKPVSTWVIGTRLPKSSLSITFVSLCECP